MNKITKKEFFDNDYCIDLSDDTLTDDLDDYVESILVCFYHDGDEDIQDLIEKHTSITVYEKKYFRLPKGYLRSTIDDYMYDSWYCEDPECYITDYESITKFEEEFNSKQQGWYIRGKEVGTIDLSEDIEEAWKN